MQDRYAGDAGDFSKLGLLRALAPGATGAVGIVWYRVPDESHNADGKHVGYLKQPQTFRRCDPELFDALGPVVHGGARNVADLAARCVPGWVSVEEHVPAGAARKAWLARAVAAVEGCRLVCLDPDNGLAPPSVGPGARTAPKFVFEHEFAAFAATGATVVVYQHLHRIGNAETQALRFAERLSAAAGHPAQVVRYRRGSGRLYGVVGPDPSVPARLDAFVRDWSPHFERCGTAA
jgi:hypothetical protein